MGVEGLKVTVPDTALVGTETEKNLEQKNCDQYRLFAVIKVPLAHAHQNNTGGPR